MDTFVLLVLHTFNIATVLYTVTSMRDFFRFALANSNSVYIRKTSQVSLSVIIDAFVLRVLHTFNIETVVSCNQYDIAVITHRDGRLCASGTAHVQNCDCVVYCNQYV